MPGVPVKLTFDLRYPDHARAYEILKAQKHTTQFVVSAILTASPIGQHGDAVILENPCQVTDRIPISNPQADCEQLASNPSSLEVTCEGEKTRLEDIPEDLLKFL